MNRRRRRIGLALTGVLVLYLGSFLFSYDRLWVFDDPKLMADVARLAPAQVQEIREVHSVDEIGAALAEARAKGWKVSISGSRHSQGGQSYVDGALVLDMRGFNQVLDLDVANKVIRVQSGARWKDIQEAIAPHGLAIKVMQSSYVFTVGGTLSADAHGRDLDKTSVVEVVRSFRLMTADGQIHNVSREDNPELFKLVIGGYGMFGVILDVHLDLASDEVYEQRSVILDYQEFPEHFAKKVKSDPAVRMMLVRPSFSTKSFLRELVVTTWSATDRTSPDIRTLTGEEHVFRDKLFFGMSRRFRWERDLRWSLQKKRESGIGETRLVSRNNAMRPPLAPLELLDYYSSDDTDIIQEYYVPTRNFVPFMDRFRDVLVEHDLNVISFTIRYVKANDETYLAYAPKEDCFAIIQMSNVGLSKEDQAATTSATQALVDAAADHGGTYYLTYQLYPTNEQLRRAYPNADHVFAQKRKYDPGEMFMSKFYDKYGHWKTP
jgi:decaprenylphospho-beta-D-ribofuranose 2-oxidase